MKNWQILQKLIDKWEEDSEFEGNNNCNSDDSSETFDQCARELSDVLVNITESTDTAVTKQDILEFADCIKTKLYDRRRTGSQHSSLYDPDAVKAMIMHKLAKDGWTKIKK